MTTEEIMEEMFLAPCLQHARHPTDIGRPLSPAPISSSWFNKDVSPSLAEILRVICPWFLLEGKKRNMVILF